MDNYDTIQLDQTEFQKNTRKNILLTKSIFDFSDKRLSEGKFNLEYKYTTNHVQMDFREAQRKSSLSSPKNV